MRKYTYLHTPIGLIEIAQEGEGLVAVNYAKYQQHPLSGSMILQEAKWQLEAYFEGKRKEFNLPLSFDCSNFYKEIYTTLLNVPYATTISYKELATLVGKPDASKAVATAISSNKFPILVPCHRVLKSDGSLGEYTEVNKQKTKQWLIDHEKGIIA